MLKQQLLVACLAAALAGAAFAQSAVPESDADARRKQNEEMLQRAAAEEEERRLAEEKRLAAIAAYEKAHVEREKQLVREKEDREARRARAELTTQCQFKSVMSDEEIARCKAAFRN